MHYLYIFPIFEDEYDELVEALKNRYKEMPCWKYKHKRANLVDYNGRKMIDGYIKIDEGKSSAKLRFISGIPIFMQGTMFSAKSVICGF